MNRKKKHVTEKMNLKKKKLRRKRFISDQKTRSS